MSGSDKPEQDEVTAVSGSPPSSGAAPPSSGANDFTEASSLDAAVQGHIGRQLRTMYDTIVEQAVPDRFLRLLDELERKGQSPP